MKSNVKKLIQLSLLLSVTFHLQGQPDYINEGVQIGRPEIFAKSFYNSGLFEIVGASNVLNDPVFGQVVAQSDLPLFSPQGVARYTNDVSGVMRGDFNFANHNPVSFTPAEQFRNLGSIESFQDLLIFADTIENSGSLDAGSTSRLEIRGKDIDFTFGKLNAATSPDFTFGGGVLNSTNYVNPNGVEDFYWGVGTNQVLATDGNTGGVVFDHTNYLIPTNFLTPPHQVVNAANLRTNTVVLPSGNFPGFSAADYDVSVFTNAIAGTNPVTQIALFRTNFPPSVDTNTFITATSRWVSVNDFAFPIVHYQYNSFNNFEDAFTVQHLYIWDQFATVSDTNRFLMQNFLIPTNNRPNTFGISRDSDFATQGIFDRGAPGNTIFTNTLLVNPSLVTTTVSNSFYAAYAFELNAPEPSLISIIGGVVIPQPAQNSPLRHPTNMVGRMIIEGNTVDLSYARIRAENYLKIQASEMVGTPPSSIDSLRYDLELSSTSDSLTITNIIQDSISRFSGRVGLHSTLWTNQVTSLSTNVDAAGVETVTTNFSDGVYHVFVVDPIFESDRNAEVLSLKAKNPNKIVIGDNMSLSENVVLDAPEVEIYSRINTDASLPSLNDSVFPSLKKLTFNGSLNMGFDKFLLSPALGAQEISFGNGAAIVVSDINLSADKIGFAANSSLVTQFGDAIFTATDLNIIDGSQIIPNGRLIAQADNINLGGSIIDSEFAAGQNYVNPLFFNVGKMIHDDGIGAQIITSGGLNLNGSNLQGDLSFSTIRSTNLKFRQTVHTWAAADHGATLNGFVNNLAVGTFEFFVAGSPARVVLRGSTSGQHALYIKTLVLTGDAETNFAEVFSFADNFKIYFQELVTANGLLMVEDVNGKYDGRFVHVPAAAAESQSNLLEDVNIAFTPSGSSSTDSSFSLSFSAEPGATYSIEKSIDLGSSSWVIVGQVTNSSTQNAQISSAAFTTDDLQAFFRIRKN